MDSTLRKWVTTLTTFLVSCLQITNVHSTAVMGVDIGSEWTKVYTLSPGVPTENAIINNGSIEKIPSAITFYRGQRQLGKNALVYGVIKPSDCYEYFLDLIGKKIDNPVVELYKKRFPQYDIVPHPERNTVLFKRSDSNKHFSPEELVAMLLKDAKDLAEYLTKEDVNEAVISVPGYFGQEERSAMLKAAEIAGIKVLQLINSYTAAALSYGIRHVDSFNDKSPVYVMFYDMGAYDTQASIVSYQLVKSEDKTVTELQPQLTVLGVGYERNLGGLEIQLRLRDYLASKFNSLESTSADVTKDPRSMAKLFMASRRLKDALSADTDHLAKEKDLIDEKDNFLKVSQEKFEELCQDFFDKVVLPAQKALESSGLNIDIIEQVILVITGTEIPRVKDRLVKDLKFSRSLNTDGAVVLGAAYKAADLSDGFEVKPFIIKDAILFPMQVIFDEEVIDDEKPAKQIKRILFSHMNTYPKYQIITFNKHQRDFDFIVGYADLNHLDKNEVGCLGSLTLDKVKLNGVKDAYSKYQGQKGIEIKEIEARFLMDDSGLLVLQSVELLVEKTITTIKEAIDVESRYLFVPPVQGGELQSSINKMTKIEEIDLEKAREQQSSDTSLDATYETSSKIKLPQHASAITDIEMKSILDKFLELSNWMKALGSSLNSGKILLNELKMIPRGNTPFTQTEINKFEKLVSDAINTIDFNAINTFITRWRDDQVEKQEKLPKNVDSVLTIEKIEEMHSSLEGELSKFTSWKLKNEEEPIANESQTGDETAKILKKQESDTIIKTKTSQNDVIEEFVADDDIVTIEDDEDSENQFKTDEFKYFEPMKPTTTTMNLKITSWKLKNKEESVANAQESQNGDGTAKILEKQDNDTIIKTTTSQIDEIEEFDADDDIVTIEDDEDSENQFKTDEFKYFEPMKPTTTAQESQTGDETAKIFEKQDNDTIIKTKTSQNDEIEEFVADDDIVTIEDDEDSENQFKTAEFKYFESIKPNTTGKKENDTHTEL